jgi:glycosyltransferase involved in cell wall biosynthesis
MISIIVPCFNHGGFLEDAVKSIFLNDTKEEKEVIIVDDASTDDSYAIALSLKNKYPIEVLRHESNRKTSATRNLGIQHAKGDLILCLDADDVIPGNYISACLETMNRFNVDIVYNNSQEFGTSDRLFDWPEFTSDKLKTGNFIHCSAIYKKTVWDTVGGYDTNMVTGNEDYEFWLNALVHDFKFKKCNTTFLWYRQTGKGRNGISTEEERKQMNDYIKTKYTGKLW